mgnify:CR=1 FL=1
MEYVNFIHECSSAIGEIKIVDDFGMSESELGYRKMIRRHVVTINSVSHGDIFISDNLALKRTSSTQALSNISDIESQIVLEEIKYSTKILI